MISLPRGSECLLVLVRHGESAWNRENRFTGWTDVDLTVRGVDEAHEAARLIREAGLDLDVAFTSVLKRAVRTLWIIQDDLDRMWLPVHRSWRLNERHYGALQGLDKRETAARVGREQVQRWRRSYGVRPPLLERADPRWPRSDPRYATLTDSELPRGESLADTTARVLPYWRAAIAPALRAGQRVAVVAHGNSLRGLVMHLDELSERDVAALDIPTGMPLVYRLDRRLHPLEHHYLADPEAVAAAVSRVVSQGQVRADAADGAQRPLAATTGPSRRP